MKLNVEHETRHLIYQLAVAILGLALSLSLPPVSKAQDQQNQSGDPAATSDPAVTSPPASEAPAPEAAPQNRPEAAAPDNTPAPPQNSPAAPRAMPPGPPSAASNAPVPDSLTLPAGTVIVVRTREWLSSDRNHPGDIFYVDLDQPLVVNGWVVARRGQPVTGHVDVAQKAGHGSGDNQSKLGISLAQVNLVDGQQVPVTTELIAKRDRQIARARCRHAGRHHRNRCDHRRRRWKRPHRRGGWNWRGNRNHHGHAWQADGHSSRERADVPATGARHRLDHAKPSGV